VTIRLTLCLGHILFRFEAGHWIPICLRSLPPMQQSVAEAISAISAEAYGILSVRDPAGVTSKRPAAHQENMHSLVAISTRALRLSCGLRRARQLLIFCRPVKVFGVELCKGHRLSQANDAVILFPSRGASIASSQLHHSLVSVLSQPSRPDEWIGAEGGLGSS